MFFIDYSEDEVNIFKKVKTFFEKLPPLATDDYENGFFDIVAQYSGGGSPYSMIGDEYVWLIQSEIEKALEQLLINQKTELSSFYEDNFLKNYLSRDETEFIYTPDELAMAISKRFMAWIDDNFNLEDMMEGAEEDEEEDEDEDEEYEEDTDEEKEDVESNANGLNEKVNFQETLLDDRLSTFKANIRKVILASMLDANNLFEKREYYIMSQLLSAIDDYPFKNIPSTRFGILCNEERDYYELVIRFDDEILILAKEGAERTGMGSDSFEIEFLQFDQAEIRKAVKRNDPINMQNFTEWFEQSIELIEGGGITYTIEYLETTPNNL